LGRFLERGESFYFFLGWGGGKEGERGFGVCRRKGMGGDHWVPSAAQRGGGKVPFRAAQNADDLLREYRNHGSEAVARAAAASKAAALAKAGMPRASPRGGPGGGDVVSSMANRLGALERELADERAASRAKDLRIASLEREVKAERAAAKKAGGSGGGGGEGGPDAGGGKVSQEVANALKREVKRLRKQVWEMECFLHDYGMIWVGDGGEEQEEEQQEEEEEREEEGAGEAEEGAGPRPAGEVGESGDKKRNTKGVTRDGAFEYNIGVLVKQVEELNYVAGDGTKEVQVGKHGERRFQEAEALPLAVYRDGILLKEGPFRGFAEDKSARAFIIDILDGYFPYELKDHYPDGVPFLLIDKSTEDYRKPFKAFSGQGRQAGGGGAAGAVTVQEAGWSHAARGQAMGREAFLNRLPKNVVKGGRVISIRDDIAEMVGKQGQGQGQGSAGGGPKTVVVNTPAMDLLSGGADLTPVPISTLQVKSEDGATTFVIKMRFDETVGDLRAYLEEPRTRAGFNASGYDVRTPFPNRSYSDTETLADAGLVPNAVIILRKSES